MLTAGSVRPPMSKVRATAPLVRLPCIPRARAAVDNPPVNALSWHVRQGLADGMDAAVGSGAAAVVLRGDGRTFIAGADLSEFGREARGPSLPETQLAMEQAPKPVVAAIHGTALGGGLEICLACHYRIAADDPKIEIGFPEVTLGLLPGGGGVTRVTRMLGLADALMGVLLQGNRFKPAAAKEKGLVDELVASRDELVPAAKAWVLAHKDDEEAAVQPWDRPGYKMPGGTSSSPKLAQNLPAFPANLRKQLKGAPMPAPRAALAAAVEG